MMETASEDYIHMCEAATELNNYWRPGVGDRVYLKKDLFLYDGKLTMVKYLGQDPIYKEGIYHLSEENLMEIADPQIFFSFCVFLPSQEQLQQKILKAHKSRYQVLNEFYDFAATKDLDVLIKHHTFNEVWLMFYYYTMHGKIWNGEDWILPEVIDNEGILYSFRRNRRFWQNNLS